MKIVLLFLLAPLFTFSQMIYNQFSVTSENFDYENNTTFLNFGSVNDGNLVSIVSENTYASLILIDTLCTDLFLNSQIIDATCSETSDGQIIVNANGGESPYLYSLFNSSYASDSIFTSLNYGTYYVSVKDANGCQSYDTINLGPQPVLPDSIWFAEIHPYNANIYWQIDSLVDGYKFRYREVGQPWQGPVASGFYSNGIAEMFTYKTLNNLNSSTNYEVQVKVNSLTGCEEGWSAKIYTFATPMESYDYNVDNTCFGLNLGQIEFELISNNSYTFNWNGPNGFVSSDTSIYNLSEGNWRNKLKSAEKYGAAAILIKSKDYQNSDQQIKAYIKNPRMKMHNKMYSVHLILTTMKLCGSTHLLILIKLIEW